MTRTLLAVTTMALALPGTGPHGRAQDAAEAPAPLPEDRSFGSSFAVLEADEALARALLVIGWPDWTGSAARGRVLLVAAKDGALLREYAAPELRGFGEVVAAAGDVDGDGREDLAVGAIGDGGEEPSTVLVYSAARAEPLHFWRAEQLVAHPVIALSSAGDLDADGRADLAYCFGGWDDEQHRVGALVARSGRTGEVLFERAKSRDGLACTSIHAVGDLDGDGGADLAVTSEGPCLSDAVVELVSGATGEVLLTMHGDERYAVFGHSICALPDLDGDGRGDLAIASWDMGDGSGRVALHSTADGRVLRSHESTRLGFGRSVAWLGRSAEPGSLRLLVGADECCSLAYGAVVEVSFPDGRERLALMGGSIDHHLGSAIVRVGGLDAEPRFVIGNDHRRGGDPGRVRIVSGSSCEVLQLLEPARYRRE